MTIKITSKNFKSDVFKRVLTSLLFLASPVLFSQVTVTDVFPTRVTTGSTVTVTGGSGWTNATTVSISGIDVNAVVASNGGMQLTFTIARTATSPVTNPTGNDVGPTILKIGDQDVYIGSVDPANQVLLEYIAPTVKQYNSMDDDFVVTEVFTTWDKNKNGDNFWKSSSEGEPNNSHDLLAFTYGEKTYSTGVGDDKLADKNIQNVENAIFKAYSTNGVSGRPNDLTYLTMADKIDGVEDSAIMSQSIMATAYDVLIDGANGLDLGTGISNFNKEADISFYSGDGDVININSPAPDLLITQIADAGASWSNDIYFYADIDGNIVGRPISLRMRNNKSLDLFQWHVNLYNMDRSPGITFETSYPVSVANRWDPNGDGVRGFRMVAFKLADFEVTASNLKDVNNINLMAGGTADLAFIAYNAATFKIKSPTIDLAPVSRYICDFSDVLFSKYIVFDVKAYIEGVQNPSSGSEEEIHYQWYREFAPIVDEEENEYAFTATITDTIRYKVRVWNEKGAVDLPATLKVGGTPVNWNGTAWTYPKIYYNKDDQLRFNINPRDRKLIFSSDYSEDEDLDGCDCYVPAERKVTIPISRTLTLHNNIVVEGERPVLDESGNPTGGTIPAGTFTLENNASLIQIKEVATSENSGDIIAKRNSNTLKKYDFVYWSSPVDGGKFSQIPGSSNNIYQWSVNATNPQQRLGNWVRVSGASTMENARGYIKREDNLKNVDAVFEGVPNNGLIEIEVEKTGTPTVSMEPEDMHSNLIGNPYPSAISAEKFLLKNTNLQGRVLVWQSGNGIVLDSSNNNDDPFYEDFKYNYDDEYVTYNALSSDKPNSFDGYIASGQGFVVKVDPNASVTSFVEFNNSMRFNETTGEGYDNDGFLRSSDLSASTEKQLIWLVMVNENNMASNILVGYAEGATNGKDRMYDAVSGSGGMRIYSVLDDSDLLIQGRALPFQDSDEVPLGVELLNNGIYKIGIAQVKGSLVSDAAQGIYLEDIYNNVIHDLRKTPYSFTGIAGNIKDRFILRYTNTTLSVDGPQLSDTFVYVKNDQLHVKASKNIERVLVYDLSGKKLMDHKVNGNTDAIQTAFQFPKGVYLTEIKLEAVGLVTKKVMN